MITVTEAIATAAGALERLSAQGVSVWLDGLSRGRIESGGLAELVATRGVVGATTDPSALRAAVGSGTEYARQLTELAARGVTVDEAVRMVTAADARAAADVLRPVHEATGGRDGRVSVDFDPRPAHRTAATVAEAKQLAWLVDRPNVLVRIPATRAGLPAVTEVIAEGIGVDVTLVFSLERYREVMNAYLAGLEKAAARGLDLSGIHSVASFSVSPVDTEVDKRLTVLGTDEALALRGRAALANARLAYAAYEEVFAGARWVALAGARANRQRPLFTSTAVKDAAYRDTLYVDSLVAPGSVNAMPEETLHAVAEHGEIGGGTVTGGYAQARAALAAVEQLGISYDEVVRRLEDQGLAKVETAWQELLDTVSKALDGKGVSAE
ncbi:transaldolase [Streptomyces sp. MS06]|uniref:transaldolase n=1 Tax=Streptomyces sp. MS06 TaxID=3385974 RepID=UPI0039A29CDA